MPTNDSPGRRIAPPPPQAQLPDDLICYGILPRLPVRALLRLALVCKAWRHLILGDPAFARAQARCPSPAIPVLARFHRGRFEVLSPGAAAADVAPPDASLSFLPAAGARLRLCSATSGVICLIVSLTGGGAGFFVVNPATRAFRAVRYAGDDGFRACLAYDPATAHRDGFHVVVPVQERWDSWRFWSFASHGAARRVSREEVRLTPYDALLPKPLYLGGRAQWLCDRGRVVWYDARADVVGELPTPPSSLLAAEGGGAGGRRLEGNRELVPWQGRVGIVSAGVASGLSVWALSSSSSSSSPARWEMVHSRSWDEIPGVVRPASRFLWSVVPAGIEAGPAGEGALGLAVRIAHRPRAHAQEQGVDGAAGDSGEEDDGQETDVWRREVLRYDIAREARRRWRSWSGVRSTTTSARYSATTPAWRRSTSSLVCLEAAAAARGALSLHSVPLHVSVSFSVCILLFGQRQDDPFQLGLCCGLWLLFIRVKHAE